MGYMLNGETTKGPAANPFASVLVRARNDAALIGRTLEGIFNQEAGFPFEVLVCDDASTDATREIAGRFPVRFVERPAGPYKPGRTLNAMVRAARSEVVVFNNADAPPLDRFWLAALTKPLRDAPGRPAITFANQLPRPDATALVRKDSERAFGDGRVQATWRFFFSLASSATWRKTLLDAPFDENIQFSEDVEWAWRNSRRDADPVAVIYCPEARVEHSHNYTLRQLWRRFRGEGAADRVIFGDRPSLARELCGAARETLRDFAYLTHRPRAWAEMPLAPVRRLTQRLAHWAGTRERPPQHQVGNGKACAPRILLGGIPLGCDNIGDEAILACVVRMLRESIPGAMITVASADPATADLLGVEVVPPFGFVGVPTSGFAEVVRRHDAYVWCGATGLSDYPHTALDLLETAQREGVATYIWGVGMDDELNPVFFRAHGRRRAILRAFGLLGWHERRLRERLARRIGAILPRCRGVWLRDPQSAAMLASTGFPGAKVAADTAIMMDGPEVAGNATHVDEPPTLGLCISTQRQVADLNGVTALVDAVRAAGGRVVGIPMNPKTDRALMEGLGVECIAGGTPEAVCEAAARCAVVLSSRLHLLILAANVGTPIMGIARGSKLANWLANFGREVEGTVQDCDWGRVTSRVLAALKGRGDWDEVRAAAYGRLRARLEAARAEFVAALTQ